MFAFSAFRTRPLNTDSHILLRQVYERQKILNLRRSWNQSQKKNSRSRQIIYNNMRDKNEEYL